MKRLFSLPQYKKLMKSAPFPVRVCRAQADLVGKKKRKLKGLSRFLMNLAKVCK